MLGTEPTSSASAQVPLTSEPCLQSNAFWFVIKAISTTRPHPHSHTLCPSVLLKPSASGHLVTVFTFVAPVFLIIPKSSVSPSALSVLNPRPEPASVAAVLTCQHSNPSPARLRLCCATCVSLGAERREAMSAVSALTYEHLND